MSYIDKYFIYLRISVLEILLDYQIWLTVMFRRFLGSGKTAPFDFSNKNFARLVSRLTRHCHGLAILQMNFVFPHLLFGV